MGCGVVVFSYGVEVGDDVLFVFRVFAGVVVDNSGAHCRCSLALVVGDVVEKTV